MTADPYVERVFPLGGKRGSKVDFEVVGQGVPNKMTLTLPADKAPHQVAFLPNSNPYLLDVDDFEEFRETSKEVPLPAVCNGRIAAPGRVDAWKVVLKKGESLEAELRAARFGSHLDGVLSVADAAGKELGRADAPAPTVGEPVLHFTAPAEGAL